MSVTLFLSIHPAKGVPVFRRWSGRSRAPSPEAHSILHLHRHRARLFSGLRRGLFPRLGLLHRRRHHQLHDGLGPQLSLYRGSIAKFAGNGSWSYVDAASPTAAGFRNPTGLAVDASGNLYIADSINQAVRRVSTASGAVTTTVAGTVIGGNSGNGGLATAAKLNNPTGVALDAACNPYIADQRNNVVRKITAATGIITTVAGGGIAASGADGLGDGGLATNAPLSGPADVAVDSSGNLYIADAGNCLVSAFGSQCERLQLDHHLRIFASGRRKLHCLRRVFTRSRRRPQRLPASDLAVTSNMAIVPPATESSTLSLRARRISSSTSPATSRLDPGKGDSIS